MYVAKVPNRGSPPAVLLRESYREAGKVKNRTLANLSSWPDAKVDALSRVLKGQPAPGRPGGDVRDQPQPAARACRRGAGHAAGPGPGRADRPRAIPAAGPGDRDGGRAGDRAGLQARDRPRAAGRDCRQLPGRDPAPGRLRRGRPVCGDGLARRPAGDASRTRWRPGTWPAAPWSSTTSPRPRSRGGPARWAPSATPKTGSGAACRSSTACSPPKTASRSPSRCSRAIPVTRRPLPARWARSRTGSPSPA